MGCPSCKVEYYADGEQCQCCGFHATPTNDQTPPFVAFPKLARWNRDVYITEKVDGTNACIIVTENGTVHAQSRKRIITPGKQTDNFGFAGWVNSNAADLSGILGPGYHYGEWYGKGIQRGYGLDHKRFALFNAGRWIPAELVAVPGLDVVPTLGIHGRPSEAFINGILNNLKVSGSIIAPGFDRPEGIVIYHKASNMQFKVTLEGDDAGKSYGA